MPESNINAAKNIVSDLEREFEATRNEIPEAGTDIDNEEINTQDYNDIPAEEETIEDTTTQSTVEPTAPKKKSLSRLVKPKHAINVIDFIIPAVIVFVTDKIGYVLTKKDLQLDKDEKELLQPFVEDFLDSVDIDLSNPYINLSVGLTIVYGMKILDAKPYRKDEVTPTEELTPAAQFEAEYNILIEEVLKTEKAKGRKSAMKYLADNNPEKIKALMDKYGLTDDKYLRYSTEYLKQVQQKRYTNFKL